MKRNKCLRSLNFATKYLLIDSKKCFLCGGCFAFFIVNCLFLSFFITLLFIIILLLLMILLLLLLLLLNTFWILFCHENIFTWKIVSFKRIGSYNSVFDENPIVLAWLRWFLMKDFQAFSSVARSLLIFLSLRSPMITSFHVFLDHPLGKLPLLDSFEKKFFRRFWDFVKEEKVFLSVFLLKSFILNCFSKCNLNFQSVLISWVLIAENIAKMSHTQQSFYWNSTCQN